MANSPWQPSCVAALIPNSSVTVPSGNLALARAYSIGRGTVWWAKVELNSSRLRLQRREAAREERAARTGGREHAPERPTMHPRMLRPLAGLV